MNKKIDNIDTSWIGYTPSFEKLAIGSEDFATTSRYWDCQAGSCGCGFGSGKGQFCHSNAMFKAPKGNAYGAKFYGTATVSGSLGDDSGVCGFCYRVTAKANIGNLKYETKVVVRAANTCSRSNTLCQRGRKHF